LKALASNRASARLLLQVHAFNGWAGALGFRDFPGSLAAKENRNGSRRTLPSPKSLIDFASRIRVCVACLSMCSCVEKQGPFRSTPSVLKLPLIPQGSGQPTAFMARPTLQVQQLHTQCCASWYGRGTVSGSRSTWALVTAQLLLESRFRNQTLKPGNETLTPAAPLVHRSVSPRRYTRGCSIRLTR
jgi:hypothetical protein